jgi:transcriptional regulator with XRE-family HTH domain
MERVAHDQARERIASGVRAEVARYRKQQSEVAEVLGMTQQSVSDRLLGKIGFRAEELAVLAEWLGIPVTRFLTEPERVA